MKKRIASLIESSKQVINNCSLKNGAIVASPIQSSETATQAKNYYYVWPRDAAFTCIAANILSLPVHDTFFRWCTKAQNWKKTGLFYEKYQVNGKMAGKNFQPDQTAMVLIAVHDYYKKHNHTVAKHYQLIEKSANALCNTWNNNCFQLISQDLWEERLCFPDLKENFTYSLAACSKALDCAHEMIPNKNWKNTSKKMRSLILSAHKKYFHRSFGLLSDTRIDASLLGLIWPFTIIAANTKLAVNTVKMIEAKIVSQFSVHRYEHDEYDGWMYNNTLHRRKGAGYWPLLNIWLSIYYSVSGNRARAMKFFKKVINDTGDKRYIPEQIFNNDIQVSVSPLCWSHAMFIIAADMLGYISSK
jgi:GH15 family glucan-1,4-alpha-glucosidase